MRWFKRLLYLFPPPPAPTAEVLEGFRRVQGLAYACARDIAREFREGWTEVQTANLMDVYLRDHGVKSFFHKSFAWFGERTRFEGFRSWREFEPGGRVLRPGNAVILDTAPFLDGIPGDIGYSTSLGESQAVAKAREVLAGLRVEILELFRSSHSGGEVCREVARRIVEKRYDVIHHLYPFRVLGHRMHPNRRELSFPTGTPFGPQAFVSLLSRGLHPDLLNEDHRGSLAGAWAIEPHLGGKGFGAKFEEILIMDENGPRWLSPAMPW